MLRKLARPQSGSEAGLYVRTPRERLQLALAELRAALAETETFSDTASAMAGSLLELSAVGIDEALRLTKDESAWEEVWASFGKPPPRLAGRYPQLPDEKTVTLGGDPTLSEVRARRATIREAELRQVVDEAVQRIDDHNRKDPENV